MSIREKKSSGFRVESSEWKCETAAPSGLVPYPNRNAMDLIRIDGQLMIPLNPELRTLSSTPWSFEGTVRQ